MQRLQLQQQRALRLCHRQDSHCQQLQLPVGHDQTPPGPHSLQRCLHHWWQLQEKSWWLAGREHRPPLPSSRPRANSAAPSMTLLQ